MAGTVKIKGFSYKRKGKTIKVKGYTRKARAKGVKMSRLGSKKHLEYLKKNKTKGSKRRQKAITRNLRKYQGVARKRKAARAARRAA